ncbi:UNVERIFIED_CONTAM: hypothetical protein FKN15_053590 [Acipenser sinensis]
MESIEELIARINRNTAAQLEQTERWERELGLAPLEAREREPTELELLLQKWEQGAVAPKVGAAGGVLPGARGRTAEGARGTAVGYRQGGGGEEPTSTTTPTTTPAIRSGAAAGDPMPLAPGHPAGLPGPPCARPGAHWFPSPLSLNTQTSLGCCQTSLVLPLLAAKLPLGDRTSLRRSPGEDLCPLLHPSVPRPSLRSPVIPVGSRVVGSWSHLGSAGGTDPPASPPVDKGEN